MVAIGQILSSLLDNTHNWKFQLVTNWATIIGPLSTRMHIEKIEHDTIVVGVCDSAWLQELHLLSDVLLRKINQALPAPYIKKIIFKHAFIHQNKTQKRSTKKEPIPQIKRQLTQPEHCALKSIKDPELSNALCQFLIRCQQTKNH